MGMGRILMFGIAHEVGAPDWPWSREHIGPPAGPSTNWQIKGNDTGNLYMNFFDGPQKQFFSNFDAYKIAGDKHWTDMWGKLEAGTFNTDCLGDPGSHTKPTGHTCVHQGQPLPPIPAQ